MRESLISFVLFCCAIQYVAAQTEPTPDEQTTYAPGNVNVRDVCICVVKGYCNLANANSSDDGAGGLDPRIMTVSWGAKMSLFIQLFYFCIPEIFMNHNHVVAEFHKPQPLGCCIP